MKVSSCTVLHVTAPNDTNGNPRRLYLVMARGRILAAVDEGYEGTGALACLGGPDVGRALAARITADRVNVTRAEYRRILKLHAKTPTLTL